MKNQPDIMLQPDISWVEYTTALGSIATLVALLVAIYGLHQNTVARNLQSTSEFTRKLSELRQRAFENGVYGPDYAHPAHTHAYQMLDFVEHVCFLVNHKHVTGPSAAYLLDWLNVEIPEMYDQPIFVELINKARDGSLVELKAMWVRLQNERVERKITGA